MGAQGRGAFGSTTSKKSATVAFVLCVLLCLLLVPALQTTAKAAGTPSPRSFLASPDAVDGDGTHYLGYELSPPGDYEKAATAPKLAAGVPLGAAVDLSSQIPPVGNQGSQGSCVAWATSYYYKSWSEKQEHTGWALTNPNYQFSPSFMYNQINGGQDGGSNFQDAFSLLQNKGDVDIAEMPYNQNNWTTQPTAAQLQAAKPYRIPSGWTYFWNQSSYGPFSSPNSLTNAKAWLDQGKLLVMGIPVYNDFPGFGGTPYRTYYDYNGSASLAGGHGVCIVGYNDNINPGGADADHRGGFLMVNSWGTGWNNGGYVYLSYDFAKRYIWEAWMMGDLGPDAPGIDRLSANSAAVGASITVYGSDFGTKRRNARVSFNGTSAIQTTWNNEQIVVTVPSGATSGPLTVYDWDGAPSNQVNFTVTGGGGSGPTVSGISPGQGDAGTSVSVSVTGSNFASGAQVELWRTDLADIEATGETVVGTTRIDCVLDITGAAPGTWDVAVTNTDGLSGMLSGGFTINSNSGNMEPNDDFGSAWGPLDSGVAYNSYVSPAGDNDYFKLTVPSGCNELTVTLKSIPSGTDYDLYLYDANHQGAGSSIAANNNDELVRIGGPVSGTYYVRVYPYSGYSASDPYTLMQTSPVYSPPTVSGLTPAGGTRGTAVTVSGSGFGTTRGGSYVSFGSARAASGDYVSWSDGSITVKVPGGVGGRVRVRVSTAGGTSNGSYFKIYPQISTISPGSGRPGVYVTITGQGFGSWSSGYTIVYFGSQRAISYSSWSNTRIVVRVPSCPRGTVPLTVRTAGGTTSGRAFTVL